MIQYTESKVIFFKDQEQFEKYLADQVEERRLKKDVATGLKMSGYAQETHNHLDTPAYSVHAVAQVPNMNIGIPK